MRCGGCIYAEIKRRKGEEKFGEGCVVPETLCAAYGFREHAQYISVSLFGLSFYALQGIIDCARGKRAPHCNIEGDRFGSQVDLCWVRKGVNEDVDRSQVASRG